MYNIAFQTNFMFIFLLGLFGVFLNPYILVFTEYLRLFKDA
jgi:hypothetical protein